MPLISFGCMRFQTSWERGAKVTKESQANLERIVAHALALGINHFETARGYGTSEEQLGRVLPHLDRKQIILQTKVKPYPNEKDFVRDVRDSIKTLNVDCLDLLAVHGLNNNKLVDAALAPNGTVAAMQKLREDGLVRHIGFSSHAGPDVITRAVESDAFDYMNLWYTYIYQDNLRAIKEAHARDMGVFVISPNDKGGKLYAPPHKLVRLTQPLSPMQFNDLFILAQPEIQTIPCGAAQPADFDPHVEAVTRAAEHAADVKRIAAGLDAELAAVLGADWATHYRDGLPRWHETPGQINIATVLWLWNLARAFDMTDYARMRYNLLGNGSHWFPGEKADKLNEVEPAELQKVLAESPFADRIPDILREADAMLAGEEVRRLGRD